MRSNIYLFILFFGVLFFTVPHKVFANQCSDITNTGIPPGCCEYKTDYASCHENCSNGGRRTTITCTKYCETTVTPEPPPPVNCESSCVPGATQCPIECPVCTTSGTCGSTTIPEPTATPTPTRVATATPTRAATPTPTDIPACNTPCSRPADCTGAIDGCTVCAPASGGGSTCQRPPTATPTPTASPTPTATPTPDPFSPAMCKCDGIDISGVASGRATTVTAAAKVEGADTTYAKIQSMKFTLGKGTAASTVPIISSGDITAEIAEETATKVRYKSVWNFTMPTLERNVEHRIWATIKCIKKLAILPGVTGSSVVLGESTENPSIFSKAFRFLINLTDGKDQKQTSIEQEQKIAQAEKAVSEGQVLAATRRDNLQLETFIPGQVLKKTCQTVYFKSQ